MIGDMVLFWSCLNLEKVMLIRVVWPVTDRMIINLTKSKKSLQVREMRIWFNDLRRNGEFNKYKLSSLISLTNYQRAISLGHGLKFKQLIKIIYLLTIFI